jgi:hypothetical protein
MRLLRPSPSKARGWALERTAFRFLQLALFACLFWWAIDSRELIEKKKLRRQHPVRSTPGYREGTTRIERKYDIWRARWVVGFLLLLVPLWLVNPASRVLQLAFAVVAIVRLWEILTTGLGTSLALEQQIRARNLVTIAIYASQATLIFAILYHSLAAGHFSLEQGPSATGAFDYLYASWANLTSLGSTFEPEGGGARFLAVLTTTTGIVLLGVLLAFGIDTVKDGESRRRETARGRPLRPCVEAGEDEDGDGGESCTLRAGHGRAQHVGRGSA